MTIQSIKKILTSALLILLSVAMVACFAGCNQADVDPNTDEAPNTDSNTDPNADPNTDPDVNTDEGAENDPETDGTEHPSLPDDTENTEGADEPDEEPVKKRVAMTFDDGPHNIYTQAVVDELAKYGYHATFFVVGNRVDGTAYGGGKMIPYILVYGNEIGIHGYTHEVYYNECDDATYEYELNATLDAIHQYASYYDVKLMRPIGGGITAQRTAECDYAVIMWNVDSEDWRYKYTAADTEASAAAKVDAIVEKVMSQVRDGSIILMHDIYQSTVDATVQILARLNAEGYEVVTVSELLGTPQAGIRYSER